MTATTNFGISNELSLAVPAAGIANRHSGCWCDITFPEHRLAARDFIAELVQSGDYPSRLWE